jgi:hypothetical protein
LTKKSLEQEKESTRRGLLDENALKQEKESTRVGLLDEIDG